jgi:hypothetical protein
MEIPSSWRMRAARVQATSLDDMATDSHRGGSAFSAGSETKSEVRSRNGRGRRRREKRGTRAAAALTVGSAAEVEAQEARVASRVWRGGVRGNL